MALPKTATRNDLARVRAAYAFEDEDEVTAFLEEHPFLIPLLEEARGPLTVSFGVDTPIRLAVWLDPENEEDRALFARAETGTLPVRESLARLWEFYDAWWRDMLPVARDLLRFDVG